MAASVKSGIILTFVLMVAKN